MTTIKTPAIVAISMAVGIIAGAGVSTLAVSQTKTTVIIKDNNNQPNMRSALDHLNAADAFLAKASDNKGGHKVKARSLIKLAIGEVRAGIRFAN